MTIPSAFSNRAVKKAFNQHAKHYDESAVVHLEVGQRMLSRMAYLRDVPGCILDLGCNTGRFSLRLLKQFPKSNVIALDLAKEMLDITYTRSSFLQRRKMRFICADALQLPLQSHSVDMVFSNLVLQWCGHLSAVFTEVKRVLKPGGVFMFSMFGPDTLKELRNSWAQVDDYDHVHSFLDMHDIGDKLVQNAFQEPVMDMDYLRLTYATPKQLFRDLKQTGASNLSEYRRKGLTGKKTFRRFETAYANYRTPEGLYPATYEIINAIAYTPTVSGFMMNQQGEVSIPISHLQKK